MLLLNKRIENDSLYITLKGKLTEKEVRDFKFHFLPYLQDQELKFVICNCKDLKKIDYLGKLALLKLKLSLKSVKKKLILSNVSNELKESFIGYRMRIL